MTKSNYTYNQMDKQLTIQQAADELGVSTHTLRFYEREGMLGTLVDRNTSGHRRYSEQVIMWVRLLLCLRQTGMPLSAVKVFADMSRQGTTTTKERLAMLRRHDETLLHHVAELQIAHDILQTKIKRYETLVKDDAANAELAHTMQVNR